MAKLPTEGELVKQRDFYNLAADALLTNGSFRGYGHYLYGPVDTVAKPHGSYESSVIRTVKSNKIRTLNISV